MMDTNKTVYTTQIQKRKLIRLITQNPQLVHFKASQDFNFKDSQRLWKSITNQCNALPGARKTWKQWRKVSAYNLFLFYLLKNNNKVPT